MAKEPDAGKKPGEERPDDATDNLLSDTSMDDLDLESLLAEDEDVAPRPPRPAAPATTPAAEDDILVVDDGEIDLLADDEPASAARPADEPEEILADDLLADDDAGEETKSLSESSTNGSAAGEPASDDMDGLSDIDLLADDEPTAEVPPAAAPETVEASAGAAAGAAAAAAAQAAASEPGEKPAKGAKKPVKLKGRSAAGPRAAKKEKPRKESAPKKTAEKPPVAVASGKVRGSVTFICSECYEEFLLPSSYASEMLSCPECLHVGKRPDEDFLRTVNLHKGGERTSLVLAVAAAILLLGVLGAAVWMTSDNYLAANKRPEETILYGLAGGSVLLTGVLLWLVSRYEKNRWEVYF
jgi:hypothetical protein